MHRLRLLRKSVIALALRVPPFGKLLCPTDPALVPFLIHSVHSSIHFMQDCSPPASNICPPPAVPFCPCLFYLASTSFQPYAKVSRRFVRKAASQHSFSQAERHGGGGGRSPHPVVPPSCGFTATIQAGRISFSCGDSYE